MNDLPNRSFLGVVIGFTCVFFLFVKRRPKPVIDDAEALLQHAQSQMREAQAKNRERAVQAITAKNQLQAQVDQAQRMVDNLGAKAQKAHEAGDFDLERHLTIEQAQYERSLQKLKTSLQSATETTEAVKTAMRREEEHIRARTAEALTMKSHYKQAQIEFEIERSRLDMTTTHAGEWFERAQAKIQQAQARRDLMAQIRKTVETLEAAAETAAQSGDEKLRRQLLSERNELKKAALNPKLWKLD